MGIGRVANVWMLAVPLLCGIAYGEQPWLSAVGERTVVCCGRKAEPQVRQAAERVLAELRKSLPPDPPAATWEYGGHSYALYGASFKGWLTWEQSRRFCEKLGGHLITLGSQGEQDALMKAMDKADTRTIFIGLSGDWHENQWAWITGEPMTYRGFRKQGGQEVYARMGRKGEISPRQAVPSGPHEPVRFTVFPNPGWYLDDREIEAFVCEWDKPGAAPPGSPRTRVAARGEFVLVQSFDDLAGEAILRQAAGQ